MNIAVVCGGISPERNVSLVGGLAATNALESLGHSITIIDPAFGSDCIRNKEQITIDPSILPTQEILSLPKQRLLECVMSPAFDGIDIAFLLIHGTNGEDGVFQAMLEAMGIRYTGSKVLASALAMDKVASKMMMSAMNIMTPPWAIAIKSKGDFEDNDLLQEIITDLPGSLVIKPNNQGSTVGMSILHRPDIDSLRAALIEAGNYADVILIELYIEGRELTVAVLGDEALPIIEIVPEGGFYDYKHKYTKGETSYHCPAELSEDVTEFVQNLAISAHKVLGCTAYSRVDFRLDEEQVPYCLEVNTIPGFSSTSLVPMAAKEHGIEFPELCERIIAFS
ncbi:MAG: D-alanine--D-alanine ligase [Candidatus Kapaibacteriota bacterium]